MTRIRNQSPKNSAHFTSVRKDTNQINSSKKRCSPFSTYQFSSGKSNSCLILIRPRLKKDSDALKAINEYKKKQGISLI